MEARSLTLNTKFPPTRGAGISVLWPESNPSGITTRVLTREEQGLLSAETLERESTDFDESKSLPQGLISQVLPIFREGERSDAKFSILSGFYAIREPIAVRRVLAREPALVKLLFGALPAVKEAWGPDAKRELQLLEDPEDDSSALVVHISSNHPHPYQALDQFDENWWLSNVQSSGGLLNFSVEAK